MIIKKKCAYCKKVFFAKDRFSKLQFCSRKCHGKWQRGKTFEQQHKSIRPKRFCSSVGCNKIHFGRGYCQEHYIEYIRIAKPKIKYKSFTCKYCGKKFSAHNRSGGKLPVFCSSVCMGLFNRKPHIVKNGYKKILIPTHPRADAKGYVFEHIIIAESILERRIERPEEVHHVDGNKLNNAPENIIVYPNHSEHMKAHRRPL